MGAVKPQSLKTSPFLFPLKAFQHPTTHCYAHPPWRRWWRVGLCLDTTTRSTEAVEVSFSLTEEMEDRKKHTHLIASLKRWEKKSWKIHSFHSFGRAFAGGCAPWHVACKVEKAPWPCTSSPKRDVVVAAYGAKVFQVLKNPWKTSWSQRRAWWSFKISIPQLNRSDQIRMFGLFAWRVCETTTLFSLRERCQVPPASECQVSPLMTKPTMGRAFFTPWQNWLLHLPVRTETWDEKM